MVPIQNQMFTSFQFLIWQPKKQIFTKFSRALKFTSKSLWAIQNWTSRLIHSSPNQNNAENKLYLILRKSTLKKWNRSSSQKTIVSPTRVQLVVSNFHCCDWEVEIDVAGDGDQHLTISEWLLYASSLPYRVSQTISEQLCRKLQ